MSGSPPRFRHVPAVGAVPSPQPGEEPIVWFDLATGLRVGLRPVHPEDREALIEGFASLSEDSRYHRFLTPMSQLSERQARYLTEIDQVNHFAWGVGVRDADGSFRGIGVARYVREQSDPAAAEIAVAIADDYHGMGIGSLLVGALAVVAATHGVERLTGYMLAENRAMISIFERLGAVLESSGPGLVRARAALRAGTLAGFDAAARSELVRVADRASHPSARHRTDPPDGAPPSPG